MVYAGQNIKKGPLDGFDEVWDISMRPVNGNSGITRHPELAPSEMLEQRRQDLIEVNEWCPKAFREIYVPEYIRQVSKSAEARESLNYLYKNREKGSRIAIVYPREEEGMSPEGIVIGLLDTNGEYFRMYMDERKKAQSALAV